MDEYPIVFSFLFMQVWLMLSNLFVDPRASFLFVQVWLMLNNLLVDPKARAKYDMDEYRKETVLRVRRYMNDILLDQLPILKDLQRVLDELTMGVSSQQDESQTTRLIIEQVGPEHCKPTGRVDSRHMSSDHRDSTLRSKTAAGCRLPSLHTLYHNSDHTC